MPPAEVRAASRILVPCPSDCYCIFSWLSAPSRAVRVGDKAYLPQQRWLVIQCRHDLQTQYFFRCQCTRCKEEEEQGSRLFAVRCPGTGCEFPVYLNDKGLATRLARHCLLRVTETCLYCCSPGWQLNSRYFNVGVVGDSVCSNGHSEGLQALSSASSALDDACARVLDPKQAVATAEAVAATRNGEFYAHCTDGRRRKHGKLAENSC